MLSLVQVLPKWFWGWLLALFCMGKLISKPTLSGLVHSKCFSIPRVWEMSAGMGVTLPLKPTKQVWCIFLHSHLSTIYFFCTCSKIGTLGPCNPSRTTSQINPSESSRSSAVGEHLFYVKASREWGFQIKGKDGDHWTHENFVDKCWRMMFVFLLWGCILTMMYVTQYSCTPPDKKTTGWCEASVACPYAEEGRAWANSTIGWSNGWKVILLMLGFVLHVLDHFLLFETFS